MTSRAVSAPGKVLLAGGYLVLDRQYTGLVFGLSARVHVHIQAGRLNDCDTDVLVRSPQFRGAQWRYSLNRSDSRGIMEVVQQEE